MVEDYVSFETAKLLKEKGFDEPVEYFYKYKSKQLYRGTAFTNTQIGYKFYNAPTLQMAMKWLRDTHNIFISIQQHMDMSYVWYIYADGIPRGCDRESHNNSYEQVCESAIKYCLENLI